MRFDRARIKYMARFAMRQARPRPWRVTLVYKLLTLVLPVLLFCLLPLGLSALFYPVSLLGESSLHLPTALVSGAMVLVYLALLVLLALLWVGHLYYCRKLWQEKPGAVRDLFLGFSMARRLLALLGLILLFLLLWSLPALGAMALSSWLTLRVFPDSSPMLFLPFLIELGWMAWLINRGLSYSLSFYILQDHPDFTARQALRESKELMAGRRWPLFVLLLSFLGWAYLVLLCFYLGALLGFLLLFLFSPNTFASPQTITLGSAVLTLFLVLGLGLTAATPLGLWLSGYVKTALAGFYDWARAFFDPSVPPPWQDQAPIPRPRPRTPDP